MSRLSRLVLVFWVLVSVVLPIHSVDVRADSLAEKHPVSAAKPHADEANTDDDADDEATGAPDHRTIPMFSANVRIDETGHAHLESNMYRASDDRSQTRAIKSVLESMLSCQLADDKPLHLTPRPHFDFYSGSCLLPLGGSRFLRQGVIRTDLLQAFSQRESVETIYLNIDLPNSEDSAVAPAPAVDPAMARFLSSQTQQFLFSSPFFHYNWKVTEAVPGTISFRFGYSPSTLKRSALCLLLILTMPLVLLYWLGRRALKADVPDKAVVWFSYMRYLSWILTGSLIVWWSAVEYWQVNRIMQYFGATTRFTAVMHHPVFGELLGWVPPAFVWIFCFRMSHTVQQKLRGLRWTKRELTLQGLYSVLSNLFPIAMFLTGLSLLTTSPSSAAMWFVAAFVVRVIAAQALVKVTGMQPHALTSGDLRDRAFAMAQRMGVNLQQVYLIPSGNGQMANAFASSGNQISFTDFLLQRMSQREVDFVMAHELTHLKEKHPSKLGLARGGGFLLSLILLDTILVLVPAGQISFVRYLFVFCVMTVLPYFISRRFEYASDAGAVEATGDAKAAISALFKLAQLNMHPFQWSKWSEKWMSHPSILRRSQAIAQKAGIPFAEIPAIAREFSAGETTYSAKSINAPNDKVFSTQYKKSVAQKLSYWLLAILSFVPSLFALAATHIPVNTWRFLLLGMAIPVTFGALLLLSNYIPWLSAGNLAQRLKKKIESQGVEIDAWGGIYVGFSPAAAPRMFESNSYWDVGYVFFRTDRICYWGEEMQFSLRREQITDIKAGGSVPGFLRTKRVYIAWKDDERGTCGVFHIGRTGISSIRGGSQETQKLAQSLCAWWKTPSISRPVPAIFEALTSPSRISVTAAVPGALWTPKRIFAELFGMAWISALVAMLCGLPFHLTAYLVGIGNALPPGIGNRFHSPGAGWYVVCVAVLVRYLSLVPTLRYKDKPVIVAQKPMRSEISAIMEEKAPA